MVWCHCGSIKEQRRHLGFFSCNIRATEQQQHWSSPVCRHELGVNFKQLSNCSVSRSFICFARGGEKNQGYRGPNFLHLQISYSDSRWWCSDRTTRLENTFNYKCSMHVGPISSAGYQTICVPIISGGLMAKSPSPTDSSHACAVVWIWDDRP